MRLKGGPVFLCLLIFFVVVHSEVKRDEAEQVEDNEEHGLTLEKRDEEDVETNFEEKRSKSDEDLGTDREKRNVYNPMHGPLHGYPGFGHFLPRPHLCFKIVKERYTVKRRCGWWRRRHTCYKTRYRTIRVRC